MANKHTFKSTAGKRLPAANVTNAAGAPAYALSPQHALAQYAVTGCFNSTFYASAQAQVSKLVDLAYEAPPELVAKTAIYARERAFMKDTPALLCAVLSFTEPRYCAAIFPRVIDDQKMLRNFVQIIRSGVIGRKSLGTGPRRLVRQWLEAHSEETLFRGSVGQSPSLVDVIKLVHPKPQNDARRAFYGYLLGRAHAVEQLPQIVQDFEAFKAGTAKVAPEVPFQMLTALRLDSAAWARIAENASWQMTRMNLNTFARHGVFGDRRLTRLIAERLRSPEAVRKARAFPYQLLAAFRAASDDVPTLVREALQDAMEHAVSNVPALNGKVYVLVDVSGSMSSPITGQRQGATSALRCVDGAALVAAAILRKNPNAEVIAFEDAVVPRLRLNPRDSVMTNAQRLASIGGGGTDCSAPLAWLNERKARGNLLVFVSDNESWMDARRGATAVMQQWQLFKARNPQARLACLDFVPNATTQAYESADVLNVGGFSDAVFDLLALFARGELAADHWVSEIEKIAV